ncbi:hypothetical protein [Sphingomonas sanguinis]|uniref:Uncharacterized protein n=1 Tax=Sphingomonas sanguinis TaxID=33051 RepID=A0A147JA86_9SPHN|nr:hypothetical protein [Sphingomonas sanguinis]KTW14866.1 hypothetical protein NS258_06275 [Sphingomonas sanguinis]
MTDIKTAKPFLMSTAHRMAHDNAVSTQAQLPGNQTKMAGSNGAQHQSDGTGVGGYSTFDYVI